MSCHTFRPSSATRTIEDGYDYRAIKVLIGHSNVTTTRIDEHGLDRGGRSPGARPRRCSNRSMQLGRALDSSHRRLTLSLPTCRCRGSSCRLKEIRESVRSPTRMTRQRVPLWLGLKTRQSNYKLGALKVR